MMKRIVLAGMGALWVAGAPADAQTDAWLLQARTSVDPAQRAAALAGVQERLTENSVWVPLIREQLWLASSKRTIGARAHGIYGVGLYKSLDITLAK